MKRNQKKRTKKKPSQKKKTKSLEDIAFEGDRLMLYVLHFGDNSAEKNKDEAPLTEKVESAASDTSTLKLERYVKKLTKQNKGVRCYYPNVHLYKEDGTFLGKTHVKKGDIKKLSEILSQTGEVVYGFMHHRHYMIVQNILKGEEKERKITEFFNKPNIKITEEGLIHDKRYVASGWY